MATKTISVRLEAYERLRAAKREPGESFSDVILRARWDEAGVTAGAFLTLVRERGPVYAPRDLDALSEADVADRAPEDKWARG
jgi:hypothetical protein